MLQVHVCCAALIALCCDDLDLQRELKEQDGVRFFDVAEEVAAARERGSQPAHKRKRLL